MQSFNDLNNFSSTSVNYTSANDYVIQYGNNAGNLSTTEFNSSLFKIYKQTPLNTFTLPSKDLLINIASNNVTRVNDVQYFGTNGNITVWQDTASTWSVTGIRSVDDYNDVFNSTFVGSAANVTGTVDVAFTADDQRGNTRSWTATVTLVPNTLFSAPNSLSFGEDTPVNFSGIQITDNYPTATNYYVEIIPATGKLLDRTGNGYVLVNSFSLETSKTTMNATLLNYNFAPAADSTANTSMFVKVRRTADNLEVIKQIALNWNGQSHSDFSIPASYSLAEDANLAMTNASITDLRPDNILPSTQYTVTVASQDAGNVLMTYGNTTASSIQVTGTKAQINGIFGNANLSPKIQAYNDFVGNSGITYTQVNTTDNVLQANAIPISLFITNSAEYSVTPSYVAPTVENGGARFVYNIVDADISAVSYTMSFARTSGSNGNFIVNGSSSGSGPITITDSRANINAGNVTFAMNVANSAVTNVNWSLVKNRAGNVQIPLASNIALTLNPAVSNWQNTYPYFSNTSNTVFPSGKVPVVNANISGNLSLVMSTGNTGYFGTSDATAATTFNYTGTASAINSLLPQIKFWPNLGQAGNVTATFQITGSGTTWANLNLNLVGTAANVPANIQTVVSFTVGSSSYTPQLAQTLYCLTDVLIVGGGGGGCGYNLSSIGPRGGVSGGGGAGVTFVPNVALTMQSYPIVVGAGGAGGVNAPANQGNIGSFSCSGNDGNVSTAFGYTSPGGGAGFWFYNPTTTNWIAYGGFNGGTDFGGTGTRTVYQPRLDIDKSCGSGSGGAGGSGAGGRGTINNCTQGGTGGNGFNANISGVMTSYAVGGNGATNTVAGSDTPGSGGSPINSNGVPYNGRNGGVIIKWKSR